MLTPDDERLLDRLVDGELSETERRSLLLRLEQSPDGWRRCALAFLEAQAWRGEARSFVQEPAAAATPASRLPRSSLSPWIPFALAASFMLVVGTWAVVREPAGNPVATIKLPPSGSPALVSSGQKLSSPQNLRLVVNGGPNEQADVVEVPIVDSRPMNEAMFGPLPQQLPPHVVKMLEQAGHQVVRERKLVPVDLRDGRRVVVPMDQVDIRPVGLQGYQ
jgi:hypothetical protein